MTRRHKLLTGLSTLTIASALALSAWAEGEGESEGKEGEGDPTAVSEGEGEGEGKNKGEGEGEGEGKNKNKGEGESEGGEGESEGGESEGASSSADPASDDVEYIRRLGFVRGHLIAFAELHHAGEVEQALMHAKHPESELYAGLAPAFAARGASGFAESLTAITAAATEGGDIDGAYAAVVSQIDAHMPEVGIADRLMAISNIMATAGDEFAQGVKKRGAIRKPHEYQDAYGFVVAAKEILAGAESQNDDEAKAVATASEQIDKALAAFSGLTATKTTGKASALYGAAARIEIAALGLK